MKWAIWPHNYFNKPFLFLCLCRLALTHIKVPTYRHVSFKHGSAWKKPNHLQKRKSPLSYVVINLYPQYWVVSFVIRWKNCCKGWNLNFMNGTWIRQRDDWQLQMDIWSVCGVSPFLKNMSVSRSLWKSLDFKPP